MSTISRARRAAAALIAGAVLAVVPALTASAHVSVSSSDAAAGKSGTLVFRVPTESDTASTVGLTVELPQDTPFRSVSALAMPGWSIEITKTTLDEPVEVGGFTLSEVATSVTWTADGAGVAPGEYAKFELRVGPFPEDGGTFAFPATQSYDDGEVVAWADPVVEGQAEPDHPAPTLTVSADGAASGHDDTHGADAGADDEADAGDGDASDSTARILAIAGLVLGAGGVAVGLSGRRRGPKGASAS